MKYYGIMNIKTNVVFSITAITAAVSLFAAGPLVATQQAHAQWWGGGCGGCGFPGRRWGMGALGGCCGYHAQKVVWNKQDLCHFMRLSSYGRCCLPRSYRAYGQ